MEEDFQVHSEETLKKINHYNIPYKWRDSCLADLLDLKQCEENYKYTSLYHCSGFKEIWHTCQFEREKKIIASENLKPVPEEKRRQSY